jgi:hypothetical protein
MHQLTMIAIDVAAVAVLAAGLYFPRHRRRDLVVAYVAVNLGVLAVTVALGSGAVGVGLGLGLFGVLSIIRLRSEELEQHEVAYSFVALAIGLLSGVALSPAWIGPTLVAVLLGALYVADHPRLLGRYRTTQLTLERALPVEADAAAHAAAVLGAHVHRIRIRRVNLVDDTTVVEVRYELPAAGATPPDAPAEADAPPLAGRATARGTDPRLDADGPLLLDGSRP